jgi:hypothetical protein
MAAPQKSTRAPEARGAGGRGSKNQKKKVVLEESTQLIFDIVLIIS